MKWRSVPAGIVIAKFGGTRPMARVLGLSASTVQNWKRGGHIPARKQPDVLNAARRANFYMFPSDFFEQG